jgi:hypothetical protein
MLKSSAYKVSTWRRSFQAWSMNYHNSNQNFRSFPDRWSSEMPQDALFREHHSKDDRAAPAEGWKRPDLWLADAVGPGLDQAELQTIGKCGSSLAEAVGRGIRK